MKKINKGSKIGKTGKKIGKLYEEGVVYTIEDDKYGLQAIFYDEHTANEELATGKYHISGYGACVIERSVLRRW